MITLLTGAPGAGKTALAVTLALEAVAKGRAVFVHGLDSPQFSHVELAEPHRWHDVVPDGALIFIDEVQAVWRPARAGTTVPPDVQALETHRHRGIDFIITTQHPNLLHANVRRLVGRHVHLQDFGFLGRRWYEWSEASDCSKGARSSALVNKRYRLPKKAFSSYTSASIHVAPKRGFPIPLLVAMLALPAAAAFAYTAYDRIVPASKSEAKAKTAAAPIALAPAASATAVPASPASSSQASEVVEVIKPKLAGCIQMAKRCECISTEGQSIEVELDACLRDSTRGGVGVLYTMSPSTGDRSAITASHVDSLSVEPAVWGFDAGEQRKAIGEPSRE